MCWLDARHLAPVSDLLVGKGLNIITTYMIHLTDLRVSQLNEEEGKKEDDECIVMCCAEGEGAEIAEQVRGKVLLKLREKLEGRGNVVMTRLNDDDLMKIDSLVEVDVFRSRSEAAAFFIKEGIQARKDLFEKVMPTVDKIRQLKEQAKESLSKTGT